MLPWRRCYVTNQQKSMAGLIVFTVISAWLLLCTYITLRLNNTFLLRTRRPVWSLSAFCLLATLPVWDQLIGYIQYYDQCRKHSSTYLHPEWEVFKSLRFQSERFAIKGLAVPINGMKIKYVDEQSNTTVLEYSELHARGGFLLRALSLEGSSAWCTPPDAASAYTKIQSKVKPQEIETKKSIYY